MTGTLIRAALVLAAALAGGLAARAGGGSAADGAAAGAIAGVATIGLELGAARVSVDRLGPGVVGGLVGLAGGLVLGVAAEALVPAGLHGAARGLGALLGAYLGVAVSLARFGALVPPAPRPGARAPEPRRDAVLDTSAIIDGRIAGVCEAGFLQGPLVVPRAVLDELQRLADSGDALRRSRGRRGFEVLQRLQGLPGVAVEIDEREVAGGAVDQGLIAIAHARAARVVTTDYNLGKLAELRGLRVLNVNGLAGALRPVALPGETLMVNVIREGKEPGQGVAYLEDGTMVVVDQGKRHIGRRLQVVVTSVLQTSAGRMIFGRSNGEDPVSHGA